MDKKYYSTTVQLTATLILLIGLLIANAQTVFNTENDAIYVISTLILLMVLSMIFSTIFTILVAFAMWENDELNDKNYSHLFIHLVEILLVFLISMNKLIEF